MDTRMDPFEEKVTCVQDKVTLFEAKTTQIEENFQKKMRKNMEKKITH